MGGFATGSSKEAVLAAVLVRYSTAPTARPPDELLQDEHGRFLLDPITKERGALWNGKTKVLGPNKDVWRKCEWRVRVWGESFRLTDLKQINTCINITTSRFGHLRGSLHFRNVLLGCASPIVCRLYSTPPTLSYLELILSSLSYPSRCPVAAVPPIRCHG